MTYYKATRPDGTDFRTGKILYKVGETVEHPRKRKVKVGRSCERRSASWRCVEVNKHKECVVVLLVVEPLDASTYLSVSIAPADCTGMNWPCRLFRVEPIGRPIKDTGLPNKRGCSALRVVEELPAHMALGPNGEAVAAFIERCRGISADDAGRLHTARGAAARNAAMDAARDAARNAAWDAAGGAAGDAAWDAARDAARDAACDAARDAAGAMVVRDLITPEQYDALVKPFANAGLREWVYPEEINAAIPRVGGASK